MNTSARLFNLTDWKIEFEQRFKMCIIAVLKGTYSFLAYHFIFLSYTREGRIQEIPNYHQNLKNWVFEYCNMATSPRELLDTELQLELHEWLDARISDRIQFEREQPSTSGNLPRYLQANREAAISEAMCPQRPQRYGVDIGGPMPKPWSPPRFIPPFIGPLPYPAMPPIAIPPPSRPLSAAELADCPPHKENLKKMRPTKPSEDYFRYLETILEGSLDSTMAVSTLEGFLFLDNYFFNIF